MARENLSRREKLLIASVADFFEKEKESGQCIDFKSVSSRTAKACQISMSSVSRCRQWAAKQRPTLKKARTKAGRPKGNRRIYCQCSSPCRSLSFLSYWRPPNFEQSACEMLGGNHQLP